MFFTIAVSDFAAIKGYFRPRLREREREREGGCCSDSRQMTWNTLIFYFYLVLSIWSPTLNLASSSPHSLIFGK